MDVIRLLGIRDTPLSVDEVVAAVSDHAAGGTTLFIGTVREEDHGKQVTRLSYEAHPSAVDELRRVAERWPPTSRSPRSRPCTGSAI